MFFVVTGDGPDGPVSSTCESAAAAHERAVTMSQNGLRDVLIADAEGRQYAPADFLRKFVADDD